MNKTIARLTFLLICLALLAYAIFVERHPVRSLDSDHTQYLKGPEFVQGATVDSYMLKDGQIFDIYSLSKSTANEKDCKT